jgi:putative ABC transport system ATP-binding protein
MGDDTLAEDGGASVVVARGLTKQYGSGDLAQRVLDGVDVNVPRGCFVSIMGPSGSGKSTLLHLLGGLDTPDSGEVILEGQPLSQMADDDRTKLRRNRIGIVYQFFNLIPVLTAAENVALPAVIAGRAESTYRARLDEVLEMVSLGAHRDKLPTQLSGGEQQRAAIARALFIEPALLLADEPTGNLDMRTGGEILRVLSAIQRETDQTIVMVTHDPRGASHGDEVLLLRDGKLADRLDVNAQCRGQARTDRTHEGRSRAVLRWLEDLDAGSTPRRTRATTRR